MPVNAKFENQICLVETKGFFTISDIKREIVSLLNQPGFIVGMPILFVDRNSDFKPSPHEIEETARMLSSLYPFFSSNMAIVVNNDLHFGIARMLQAYCGAYEIDFKVFREETQARSFLVDVFS